ncbi:unnamed protein product [Protopolystoma xenopodis]|uniref:Uncharacterized protein n=1 Tax=Protopolystoma xenopodis TaxID=117903 RepID=A0A3S5FES2_9PLAT|nr:unnamed protein product [Protopolystoma xenopodis]
MRSHLNRHLREVHGQKAAIQRTGLFAALVAAVNPDSTIPSGDEQPLSSRVLSGKIDSSQPEPMSLVRPIAKSENMLM